ncbi:MAG: ATP-binding protein [Bacteroidota bacterium]|nr:ATP-binding protein [Bacteroidota bacterium]
MYRDKMKDLCDWKNSSNRKPLIIKGARQVGKTWLIKEFGATKYENLYYFNFEKSKHLRAIFESGFEVDKILIALQAEIAKEINEKDSLIVFDEIQAIPEAITSLKYFCEDAPQYHIIAAGSLLGLSLNNNISFPVGKVNFMNLYPLSFIEFLYANSQDALANILSSKDWDLMKVYKSKYIRLLKHYYYVGGMPEVVKTYNNTYDFSNVRKVQKDILFAYEQDYSKHAPTEIISKIRMLWNTVPSQLAKENRKFIYGQIKKGARAKDYETAITWLNDCGQIFKVHRIKKPNLPLKSYEDLSAFKLFIVDIGLLSAMVDLDSKTIIDSNKIFKEFKGALTEQFVIQQIKSSSEVPVFYWSSERARSEVDFIIQKESEIIPIEVKSEENLQSKSLKVYYQKFNPTTSFRLSMSDYREQDWLINIPLYAVGTIF